MSVEFRMVEKALNFLQSRQGEKFTARELASELFRLYPDECQQKRLRSKAKVTRLDTDEALIQQISAELNVTTLGSSPNIKMTDERPRHYYFSTKSDEAEIEAAETAGAFPAVGAKIAYTEHDLYPMLGQFLLKRYNIFSKRIDEKRSKNNHGPHGNRWLFPDIVGFEDLSRDWDEEIKSCAQYFGNRKTRLWSFEVKKLINRSNVREAYFQAVSNSSWANFGYLVATEFQGVEEELRILAGLHGIGVIRLNVDMDDGGPVESEIKIPAREREDVDWSAANRLAQENTDFLEYLKLIRRFYQTGDHTPAEWDCTED
ncbi:MAG: HrgA protein [Alphaproteobacteria bacterium]|nr:HrgA protein [Alphaproteobacteria bacterium]